MVVWCKIPEDDMNKVETCRRTSKLYVWQCNVTHIRALTKYSHKMKVKIKFCKVQILYLHTICHKFEMFRSILIIFRKINKIWSVYENMDGLLNTLKFILKPVPCISIIYNTTNHSTILIIQLHIITYDLLLHVSTFAWLKLRILLILIKCNC